MKVRSADSSDLGEWLCGDDYDVVVFLEKDEAEELRRILRKWWIIWQSIVEPELRGGKGIFEHADAFMEWAQKNVNSDEVRDTHNAIEELKKK